MAITFLSSRILVPIFGAVFLSACQPTFQDNDPKFFPTPVEETIIASDLDVFEDDTSEDKIELATTSPFVTDPGKVLSCGDELDTAEFRLEIDSCAGMKKSFFSNRTRLVHLEQGCAFHTFIPRGRTYIVKEVEQIGVTPDGRPHFRDYSRRGVMRTNGNTSKRGPSDIFRLRTIPERCPERSKGFSLLR